MLNLSENKVLFHAYLLNIFTSVMLLDVVLNNILKSSITFPMVCLF